MIAINIPGFKSIQATRLVLDYNGTLAIDGLLIPGVKELLDSLAGNMEIHVITADTFRKAEDELRNIECTIVVLTGENQANKKADCISKLGAEKVIAVGNGRNDALMLKNAALGIAVIQQEGASKEAVLNADIICNDIKDALELMQK